MEAVGLQSHGIDSPVDNLSQRDSGIQILQVRAGGAINAIANRPERDPQGIGQLVSTSLVRRDEPTRSGGRGRRLIIRVGGGGTRTTSSARIEVDRRGNVLGAVLDHARIDRSSRLEIPMMVKNNG